MESVIYTYVHTVMHIPKHAYTCIHTKFVLYLITYRRKYKQSYIHITLSYKAVSIRARSHGIRYLGKKIEVIFLNCFVKINKKN